MVRILRNVAPKTNAGIERPELVRRIAARERRRKREESPLTPEENQRQQAQSRRFLPRARYIISKAKDDGLKGVAVIKAAAAFAAIIEISSIYYPVQLCFALLYLLGLSALIGTEESFLNYLDVFNFASGISELMFFISMVVLFLIGLITLILALGIFISRGVDVNGGIGLIIAALCLCLYLVPVFNLGPWIWLWCLYVVKNQTNEA